MRHFQKVRSRRRSDGNLTFLMFKDIPRNFMGGWEQGENMLRWLRIYRSDGKHRSQYL